MKEKDFNTVRNSLERALYHVCFILHPLFLVARAKARRTRSLAPKALMATSARLGTKAARRKIEQIRRRDPTCC